MPKQQNANQRNNDDRSFDDIADHFEKKVYGGLKGDIRLAVLTRDLCKQVDELSNRLNRRLRILDIGAGLAQISLEFARAGHEVTINDVSDNMLKKAKQTAQTIERVNTSSHEAVKTTPLTYKTAGTSKTKGLTDKIVWHTCPYQQLDDKLLGKYDVILCHALLEWLAEPEAVMNFFDRWIAPNGLLSLCFYNPVSFDYRNLIMGNFNLLNQNNYQADNKKSLTPNNPVAKQRVVEWLKEHDYKILGVSGLRVFHDYAPLKRGGHNHPEAVIEMELRYSNQEPYKWLGRYLHYMATPNLS